MNDLRGQYQLSYITLRRAGFYHTAIEIELDGVVGGFATDGYDAGSFYGLDNQGIVGLDPPSIDRESGIATVYMRSLHMPRNIDRIRFRLGSEVHYSLALVPREEGGLLEGWRIEGPGRIWFSRSGRRCAVGVRQLRPAVESDFQRGYAGWDSARA